MHSSGNLVILAGNVSAASDKNSIAYHLLIFIIFASASLNMRWSSALTCARRCCMKIEQQLRNLAVWCTCYSKCEECGTKNCTFPG